VLIVQLSAGEHRDNCQVSSEAGVHARAASDSGDACRAIVEAKSIEAKSIADWSLGWCIPLVDHGAGSRFALSLHWRHTSSIIFDCVSNESVHSRDWYHSRVLSAQLNFVIVTELLALLL
jgi:hypothetical protein